MVKPGVDVAAKIPIKVETKKSAEKPEAVEVGKEAVEAGECSGTKEEEPIFNEEWSEVKDGKLRIKLYYFPYGDKIIDLFEVKKIKYARQDKSYAKNWGSNGLTWWGCDMKRNFRSHGEDYYNVKVDIGASFRCGFTVKNLNGFMRAIRNHVPPGCEVSMSKSFC
ncbi:hypothetical protein WR25_13037 [Diploscapter pachys]|uniref:Uncharacterized protein n=1 Tax=Diploscapter pachys TaxID=2018661 RepID=A0A2A2JU81_9BILA|nr:hypothetical protein WR25_13037 [Diploscapter pachys]